jgi:head-tail adaptor
VAQPGRYNKHVTLSKAPTTTPDSDGFFEDLSPRDWWCSIQPLDASVSDSTRMQAHRVEGRYHSGITVDTRIVYGTRQLFVKGVQDVDERHQTMVLFCEEAIA